MLSDAGANPAASTIRISGLSLVIGCENILDNDHCRTVVGFFILRGYEKIFLKWVVREDASFYQKLKKGATDR